VLKGHLMCFHFQMILVQLVQYLMVGPPQPLGLIGPHSSSIKQFISMTTPLPFLRKSSTLLFAGNGEDDLVQLAVGQCPRKCIYYVTPCQRTILEDVLARYISSVMSYFFVS